MRLCPLLLLSLGPLNLVNSDGACYSSFRGVAHSTFHTPPHMLRGVDTSDSQL